MATHELEHHQLDLHYAGLRSVSQSKESRLLASLAQEGQQSPVVVVAADKTDRYVLIDGYKRVRSLDKLHQDTVMAVIWPLGEADALIMERQLRQPDSDGPLEQGWLLQELQSRFGMSLVQLAQRFGVSKSWVSRRLGLVQQLPNFVQQAVREGHIVAHAAMKYLLPLARANADDSKRLCRAIRGLKLSSRQIGTLYAAYRRADDQTRGLIVNQPQTVLHAEQELACKDRPNPDPLQQLVTDLDILCAVARRIRSRFSVSFLAVLDDDEQQRVKASLVQAYLDTKALHDLMRKE